MVENIPSIFERSRFILSTFWVLLENFTKMLWNLFQFRHKLDHFHNLMIFFGYSQVPNKRNGWNNQGVGLESLARIINRWVGIKMSTGQNNFYQNIDGLISYKGLCAGSIKIDSLLSQTKRKMFQRKKYIRNDSTRRHTVSQSAQMNLPTVKISSN